MLEIILNIFYFVIAFYILTKAADLFIDEASNLGKHYGMSKLMIGLTIVAVGTSLPEAITSFSSILFSEEFSEFIIGTTMGSNTTNILLAFGLFLVATGKFTIKHKEAFNVFALLSTSLVFAAFVIAGFVNYFAILLFIFYLYYIYYLKKHQRKEFTQLEEETVENLKPHSVKKSYILLLVAFVGLFASSKLAIFSIENIGVLLSIPVAYLTLTTISVATSLPEIAVTIASAKKKEYLIGIGNILGTNVMNIGIIIGLSGFMGYYAINTSLYINSLIFFLLGTVIFATMVYTKKFYKLAGYGFLALYVLYITSFFLAFV